MMMNMDGKYTGKAEYFYNEYIDMYCIIGTTYSAECLDDLKEMFERPDLLIEAEMPNYITEDYEAPEW